MVLIYFVTSHVFYDAYEKQASEASGTYRIRNYDMLMEQMAMKWM